MSMIDFLDLRTFCQEASGAWPENRLYGLVDHAAMPGLHAELVRAGIAWASLLADAQGDNVLQAAPLLFTIDDEADKAHGTLLPWLARHGTYTSSLLMLSSPLPLGELARRLTLRLDARISEDMDVVLRYFDPRVFEALVPALAEPERQAFLSVADCWWYVDRSGNVVQQPAAYAPAGDAEGPLLLSAAQEFALVDASEIDQVAAQLQSTMPDAWLLLGAPQRVAFLRGQMAAAAATGIDATHEIALYCGLALLYGEDFASTSPWDEIMTQVRGGTRLSDAVAEVEA